MIHEMGALKLNALMMNLYDFYPDLKGWDYVGRYKFTKWDVDKVKRKEEIGKTTRTIVSLMEFGVSAKEEVFKKLVMYYIVLMDAEKYNLDFESAFDDIFYGEEEPR